MTIVYANSQAPPPTIKEFEINDEIRTFGFTKIQIIANKTVLLYHNSGRIIQSQYHRSDLCKTTKQLQNVITTNNELTGIDIGRFIVYFSELLVKTANAEYSQYKNAANKEKAEKVSILEEISQLKNDNAEITLEEWRAQLLNKYQNLHKVVQKNMPEIWPGLEFELSILRILNIDGCSLPFIGIILGRPSSGKTAIIDLLRKWCYTFYTDSFTARSFVSHSTSVNSKEELEEIDLLPKIKDKLFLTPELSPTFTAKDEDLTQLLGIITRIADGHGFVSDSGAHGHRGYDDNIMFTWVGAAVDIPKKVYKTLGNLGAKLYFHRMHFKDKTEEDLVAQTSTEQDYNTKLNEIKNILFDYLKWFEIRPYQQQQSVVIENTISNTTMAIVSQIETKTEVDLENGNGRGGGRSNDSADTNINNDLPIKIKWAKDKDDKEAVKYIGKLAILLSHLRCIAQIWDPDGSGSQYGYSISQPEDPSRANTVLYNLARGHALLTGRNHIMKEDIPLIIRTVLSTAQIERVSLFSLLIASNGTLTTTQIVESLNISRPTALKTMAELKVIGLVEVQEDVPNEDGFYNFKQISLKPEFQWFLSEEFKGLNEAFTSSDNREYLKHDNQYPQPDSDGDGQAQSHCKENLPSIPLNISSLNPNSNNNSDSIENIEKEELFWQVFDNLERKELQNPSNNMEIENNTVSGEELRQKLVGTNDKIWVPEATQIINNMVKAGKLEVVMYDTYRRKVG